MERDQVLVTSVDLLDPAMPEAVLPLTRSLMETNTFLSHINPFKLGFVATEKSLN